MSNADFQDRGEAARLAAGIDGTAGDAQDVTHVFVRDPVGACLLCGLSEAHRRHVPRLLACGLCYEENGEEVHPHPECNWTAGVSTLNRAGRWAPSIPLPLFGVFVKSCGACKKSFFTMDGYRGHYALAHLIDPDRETST